MTRREKYTPSNWERSLVQLLIPLAHSHPAIRYIAREIIRGEAALNKKEDEEE